MDKNRFETLKEVVNLDPNVHPIQLLVSVEDLRWLVQQAENVQVYYDKATNIATRYEKISDEN